MVGCIGQTNACSALVRHGTNLTFEIRKRFQSSGSIRHSPLKGGPFPTPTDSTQPPDTSQEIEMAAREEHEQATKILDLCENIRQPFVRASENCFGLIFSTSLPKKKKHAYDVYPIVASKYRERSDRTMTSLNEVLRQNQRHMILSEQDRLKLAVLVTSSLLQLYEGSWMPKVIRSQDIYLIQGPR
ncbi:hypothetical protein QL093DRAFT_1224833 [Fusarium oxysporum]|nr:hypothetical protein QL093DRAFT_1224833 [Fusarium oxysporum]